MPLNYSKFDQIELSDDSDIEEHPNVDKKSFIRMKQRHIHEAREERKQKIGYLRAQIDCNKIILPRIESIYASLTSPDTPSPQAFFNSLVEQLEKNPSRDCPPGNDPSKLEHTYDGMILDLFRQVTATAKEKVKSNASLTASEKDEQLAKALSDGIRFHVLKLKETIDNDIKTLAAEEKEQHKHITSEDLRDGFSSKYVAPKPAPGPVPTTKPKKKATTTEYEVLNPTPSSDAPQSTEDEEEEEGLPELTPALQGFSRIPIGEYERSFEFIQSHRDVVVDGAADALLVAAFTAQGNGQHKYAKQCVHQSLLLQYGEKLGKDGVGVFFRKMIAGDKRAQKIFVDDLEKTYNHLSERVAITSAEAAAEAGGREQIQLVPANPGQSISFNVPDGPPPENLVLEGPGTEDLDIEEVRKALEFRWAVFDGFSDDLKAALTSGNLDAVNKVLGAMDVQDAEGIVQKLDVAGILSFSESGIRDETSKV
ncbi:hsp90-like protein [Mycena floridula]|nr:hsp90-like protein [Mycena floridula]